MQTPLWNPLPLTLEWWRSCKTVTFHRSFYLNDCKLQTCSSSCIWARRSLIKTSFSACRSRSLTSWACRQDDTESSFRLSCSWLELTSSSSCVLARRSRIRASFSAWRRRSLTSCDCRQDTNSSFWLNCSCLAVTSSSDDWQELSCKWFHLTDTSSLYRILTLSVYSNRSNYSLLHNDNATTKVIIV